jgi:NADH dehydrogenase [ubiquinone] 1 alpha subcomplex assembly factor 5
MAGPPELFDSALRSLRRDRAARCGPALFLHERALSDILERLSAINRRFSSLLLVGAPDPEWRSRLEKLAPKITIVDPGAVFAKSSGGIHAIEDEFDLDPASFDLAIAIGTLDTVNDLPGALLRLRFLLKPDSLLIGAMSGGETLPRLRQAMRAADSVTGVASPHIHPRIEPASLAQLLTSTGFVMPVVDIDRVNVAYRDLRQLVGDLRSMGATNILKSRARRPLSRAALEAADREFAPGAGQSRITETFEILHFAAWSPLSAGHG